MPYTDLKCRILEEELRTFWPGWRVVRQISEGSFADVFEIRKKEFGVEFASALKVIRYKNREIFATVRSLPIFRAVVTPDGEWYEKGEMGWFCATSETAEESLEWDLNFYERFIKEAIEKNYYLTVVDCHI